MNEKPAETMRRAAKLMRERAGAATPGPWTIREQHGRDIADEGWSDVRVVSPVGDVAVTYLSNVSESNAANENTEHLAAMHPLVALAVADWLERDAALIDVLAFPESDPAAVRYPLTVARAYLGEVSA